MRVLHAWFPDVICDAAGGEFWHRRSPFCVGRIRDGFGRPSAVGVLYQVRVEVARIAGYLVAQPIRLPESLILALQLHLGHDETCVLTEKLIDFYKPDVFCAGIKEKYVVQKAGVPLKQLHSYDYGGPYAAFGGAINFYREMERMLATFK